MGTGSRSSLVPARFSGPDPCPMDLADGRADMALFVPSQLAYNDNDSSTPSPLVHLAQLNKKRDQVISGLNLTKMTNAEKEQAVRNLCQLDR